jgi:diguanylate cyclase (GGDEF)-like protein
VPHTQKGSKQVRGSDRENVDERLRELADIRARQTVSDAAKTQTSANAAEAAADAEQTTNGGESQLPDRERLRLARWSADRIGLARWSETAASAERGVARDAAARLRDRAARARDEAAEARDTAMRELQRALVAGEASAEAAAGRLVELAGQAIVDRKAAAADRARAAEDRQQAARDRADAVTELESAHLDDLTGAYLRGIGQVALRHELERARRNGGELVLAFVDINGLKRVNDRDGYLAGDELLRTVAGVLRSRLRSYEPVVRFGGDEFVCTIAGVDVDAARRRFDEICAALADAGWPNAISIGLAAMRVEDTLTDLVERADHALARVRDRRRSAGQDRASA